MQFRIKKRLITRTYNIEDEDTMYLKHRERDEGVIFLMRKFLIDGWSVVLVGKEPHHFYGVQDVVPSAIRSFTYKTFQDEIRFPWIKGLSKSVIDKEEDVLRTFMRLPHMVGKEALVPDPNDRQCYYELSMKGSKTTKCFVEAFLTGILYQFVMQEPARRMVIFLQAPFRPKSKHTEKVLQQAIDNGLKVVYMFKGSAKGYKDAKYIFKSKGKKLYVNYKNKTYEIEDDTRIEEQKERL